MRAEGEGEGKRAGVRARARVRARVRVKVRVKVHKRRGAPLSGPPLPRRSERSGEKRRCVLVRQWGNSELRGTYGEHMANLRGVALGK